MRLLIIIFYEIYILQQLYVKKYSPLLEYFTGHEGKCCLQQYELNK